MKRYIVARLKMYEVEGRQYPSDMERTKNNAAVRTAINRRLSPERLTVFDAVRVRKNQRKIELMEV